MKKNEKHTTNNDQIQKTDTANNQSNGNAADNNNSTEDNFLQQEACQSTNINNDLELAQPILTTVSFNQQYHYHSELNYQYAHTYGNATSYPNTAYNSLNENHLVSSSSSSSSSLCCAYNQPNHCYFNYDCADYNNTTDYLYNDPSLLSI